VLHLVRSALYAEPVRGRDDVDPDEIERLHALYHDTFSDKR